jgi:citrate lyase gamma subunit
MATVKKPIDFQKDMAINVQTLATLEERSFGGQIRQLVKEALNHREVKNKN